MYTTSSYVRKPRILQLRTLLRRLDPTITVKQGSVPVVSVQLSDRGSKTIGRSMEETKEYHVRYLRAINNPLRRKILRTLKDGKAEVGDLASALELDERTLRWHMDILVYGFCVEKDEKDGVTVYNITDEGKVVDFVDK